MFIVISFTAFNGANFTDFAPLGKAAIGTAAGTIFFSFIGLDAVSTAGDEVKDPQRTMPRALIAALIIVIVFYVLVAARGARAPSRGPISRASRRPGWPRSWRTSPGQRLGHRSSPSAP